MTRKELSQLYYLNREIEHDKRELFAMRSRATSSTSVVTGLPHASGVADKTALGAEIAYLEGVIECKVQHTYYEYNRLISYINTVEDSRIRLILTLRYVNGLNWTQIAMSIGGGNTPDGVRMIHNRFLKEK